MLTKTLLAFALASVTSLAAAYKPGICDAPGGKTRPCMMDTKRTNIWYFDSYKKFTIFYRGRPGHTTHTVFFTMRSKDTNTDKIILIEDAVFCDLHQHGEHWSSIYKINGLRVPDDMRLAVEGTVVGNYAKWGCEDLRVTEDEPLWVD